MANFLKSLFVKGVEIDTASATTGKVLTYDGTKFAPATPGAGSLALDDLSDVVITSPEEFQGLSYNGTSWVNSYQPLVSYVRNAESTTLTTGTCVYLFGATGDHASVKRADNNSDTTSSKTIGVVGASITSSNNGPIITRGYVDGIDLSTGYTAGDVLWLGESGAFTTTKPTAPDHLVFIGVVVRATNNGIIYVATQNGYELDELHNVSLPSPQSGEFLKYNGSLWVADAIDLGTDTTGNYMSGISGTSPVSVTHTPAEGSSATVALASSYGDTQNPYASKTANYHLAAPDGVAGVPTFRAIVAGDIPTLNQSTTGSAAKWTTARTVTLAGDLTGSVSIDGSANATLTATIAADSVALGTDTTGNYMSGISGTSPVSVTHTAAEGSSATVALASGYGDTLNPYASKTANYVLAAPNGSNGVPTFRAIVASDIPTLNQNTTGTAATVTGAAQTAITSVGTLTSLTVGGAGANRSITINAPSSYYAIQYFQINGVNRWHYEAAPDGLSLAIVESGVAARLTVTSSGTTISGTATATTFSGSGASLTSLPAGQLTGTIANARLPTAINISSTMQAYSYQGNANVAGTGNASYHPSGIYSTGTNWLYGQINMNNNNIGDGTTSSTGANQIYANGWFRSWGDTGWYNQSYGGGVYMVDTTFVRIYNSKIFYATGGIWSVDGGTASTSGFQYLLRGATYGNYAPFTSMREVKRNIQTISNSGLLIDQLNPVTFQEKITDQDDEISTAWKNADLEYGFIADEVALVGTGHLAQYQGMDDGTLKPVGWSFHGVISVLVAEVKELRKRVTQLESTQ